MSGKALPLRIPSRKPRSRVDEARGSIRFSKDRYSAGGMTLVRSVLGFGCFVSGHVPHGAWSRVRARLLVVPSGVIRDCGFSRCDALEEREIIAQRFSAGKA